MSSNSTIKTLSNLSDRASVWIAEHLFTIDVLIQFLVILIVVIFGRYMGLMIRKTLSQKIKFNFWNNERLISLYNAALELVDQMIITFILFSAKFVLIQYGHGRFIVDLIATLFAVWIFIKVVSSLSTHKSFAKLSGGFAWLIAALHILGVLPHVLKFLNDNKLNMGSLNLSILSLVKAIFVFTLLLMFGNWLGTYLEKKMRSLTDLPPTTSVLLTKLIKTSILVVIFLVALNSAGIDLTTLAVFSGAIGVGIGFGLQKVVANLISGVILLLDKSIKPGDVIQLGEIYGWIKDLRGRYVSVVTREGKEYLIPNEDLITNQVINWSFSHKNVRINLKVGVSYNTDLEKAMSLIIDATKDIKRVLITPKPTCIIEGFGDSSVDLALLFWINDPDNGVINVKSDIYLNIWYSFKKHNIEIPFPQRDIHIVKNKEI